MAKIVLNYCYGGFGLSPAAQARYEELSGAPMPYEGDIARDDKILVRVVEELGTAKASGAYARLAIEEVPKGTGWRITEYDGNESLETQSSIDWNIAAD